jgi:UDP-N-acetylmuramate: L-alanyl-gamma-D-glutamyl-meso-diaminopimelate ligase
MTRIHLIGICGTAMATLAAMLKQKGIDVRGSDQNVYPPMSDFLAEQGITLLEGYRAEHISGDLDMVVVGNAISRGNPELEEVLDRKIRYCSLPEAIRDHFLWASRSVVIAGTHGKTTTTSLTGWLLTHGGADPSVLVGGIAENFDGSYRIGGGREFVIEGDEYDSAFFDKTAKFLKYLPDIAVVGNIEFDHADIYPDLDAIRLAFRRLVNLVPRRGLLLLGADNADALALRERALPGRDVRPVGRRRLAGARPACGRCVHDIQPAPRRHAVRQIFELPLLGAFNVRNALAAIAVGAAVGLNLDTMAEGLRKFRGIRRRMQLRGTAAGVAVYDDFAHHPTAIAETLDGVRSAFPGRRLWAIFEPRSATSCRRVFQEEFVEALGRADRVVLPAVFRSTLPDEERLSPEAMVERLRRAGRKAQYIPQVDDIVKAVVKEARDGDLVVVMSNGGFDDIHRKLLDALGASEADRP